jgi:hypothetical protein
MRCVALLLLSSLAACTAQYPEGVLACQRATDCPSGWTCRLTRYCYATKARTLELGGAAALINGVGVGGAAGARSK